MTKIEPDSSGTNDQVYLSLLSEKQKTTNTSQRGMIS